MKNQFWKKCKWILPIIIACIVITTCTAYGKEKDEENKEDEWNVDFEIERAEYIYDEQQNGIEIYYPQLCGLEDSAKEERLNALIEEDVMQVVGEKNTEEDDSFYRIYFDYKIEFVNERIISIRYRGWDGYITTGHAALDDEVIATTIDIEEEKIVTLQDVVTDLKELSDMLLAEEFESITLWEWYTDGENFIFVYMRGRYYNEYSISFKSVGHILAPEFLKKLGKNTEQEGNSGLIDNIVYEKAKAIEFENRYRILNRDIFENKTMIPWYSDETKQEIEDYAESVKGDFIEVWEKDSMFPQGLVIELENMIYQSLNRSMEPFKWEEKQKSIYFETMQKLGEEKWHPDLEEMKKLFPELNDESLELKKNYQAHEIIGGKYCEDLFHIPTSECDNYVFVMYYGGTAGIRYVELKELVNGEFVPISEFATSNAGWGTVIQYEDDFYYIFLENNYNMKIYDGVRVYKLGENMEYENIQIKHLPYAFVRKNLYNTSEGGKLDSYIEDIWEEITSDKYLDNGTDGSGEYVYFGDEEEVTEDFIVPENEERYYSNTYHQIDFANMGIPIYMRKSNHIPSNYYTTWHLRSFFYLRNPLDNSIVALQNMEINHYVPDDRYPVLVQMWFKEMDGKVYTFCLYHVSDYNYMLNVVRLEGNQVNRIRTDILSPQRCFVLTEGERAWYG